MRLTFVMFGLAAVMPPSHSQVTEHLNNGFFNTIAADNQYDVCLTSSRIDVNDQCFSFSSAQNSPFNNDMVSINKSNIWEDEGWQILIEKV